MVETIVPEVYPYTEAGTCGGVGLHHGNLDPKSRYSVYVHIYVKSIKI